MTETAQEAPKFIFEGNEYEIDSLSPQQVSIIQSVQVADQKLGTIQSELLLLNKGRDGLIEDLRESLAE
ncbi:DUF6447 family protein [bacterium]|nr:DUF6447 family protein [bacterium]